MRKLRLEELNRVSVEDFKVNPKLPIVVVLDNIRSAMNVGSFFRTCDAFPVEKIVLCGITATPPNREITKTAIGATESVAWEYSDNLSEVIATLKSNAFEVIGIEQTTTSIMLDAFPISKSKKYALIFGNEVDGVSNDAIDLVANCIEIPQMGTKHSLNVSVCGGVVLWHFFQGLKD